MPFQPHTGPLIANGIELYCGSVPCHGETVSGDALFVETGRSDGAVMVLLVDVMGHGRVAAAVVAALGTQYLRLPVCQGLRPATLLNVLHNQLLTLFDTDGLYVTAQALLIDGHSRAVCGANAAVPDPWLGLPGGVWQAWPLPAGPLLGMFAPNATYSEAQLTLAPGQLLIGFTDGVTEAGRGKSQQFQHGHLQHFLSGLPAAATPQSVVLDLLGALWPHVGVGWPEDDTTIVAVRRC